MYWTDKPSDADLLLCDRLSSAAFDKERSE